MWRVGCGAFRHSLFYDIGMTLGANDEAAWLRFILNRLRAAVRYAGGAEISAILRELIRDIENRLDDVEKR
jgi:hypothetical protein